MAVILALVLSSLVIVTCEGHSHYFPAIFDRLGGSGDETVCPPEGIDPSTIIQLKRTIMFKLDECTVCRCRRKSARCRVDLRCKAEAAAFLASAGAGGGVVPVTAAESAPPRPPPQTIPPHEGNAITPPPTTTTTQHATTLPPTTTAHTATTHKGSGVTTHKPSSGHATGKPAAPAKPPAAG